MTKLKLTNTLDLAAAETGHLPSERIRSMEVGALVDTGAMTLAIPADIASALGLVQKETRMARLADGTLREVPQVTYLTIEILGRSMACDAMVLPEGTTPLIGQIPLEGLDLVVDPRSREAIVNPRSPNMPMVDLLRAS